MTNPETQSAMSTAIQPSPMLAFILGLLTQMLSAAGIADPDLASRAAAEAIETYAAAGSRRLVTAGEVIAFGLAALDALRLSMAPDLSLSMKLKLRSCANGLNRSVQASTKRLESSAALPAAACQAPEPEPQPAHPLPDLSPAPIPPGATQDHQNALHWANAMRAEAARLHASDAHVPPDQRKINRQWVDVLGQVADELTQGKGPTQAPGMSRAELMRTTLMSHDPGFPAHLIPRKPRTA
jgi:hypothetical protein